MRRHSEEAARLVRGRLEATVPPKAGKANACLTLEEALHREVAVDISAVAQLEAVRAKGFSRGEAAVRQRHLGGERGWRRLLARLTIGGEARLGADGGEQCRKRERNVFHHRLQS